MNKVAACRFLILLWVCIAVASVSTADTTDTPLAPGEISVDGRLIGPLSSFTDRFTVDAEQVETPDPARFWLSALTPKTVLIGSDTQFFIDDRPAQNIYYQDDGRTFFHIRAVGIDHGAGQPLNARFVWLTRETPAERFLFDHFVESKRMGSQSPKPAPRVACWSRTIEANGRSFAVSAVSADLSTSAVRCGIACGAVGATEPLASIAARYGAIAAINGSFFDAYDPGPVKMPDMPLVSRGSLVHYGSIGTLIGFTESGQCRMDAASTVVRMCGPNSRLLPGDDPETFLFWSHVTEAVGCGPRLLVDGAVKLNPAAEGILSGEVLNTRTTRSAVGITADGHILFVVVRDSNLDDLAHVLSTLGCRQAMNLDGGSSSGLWYRGRTVVNPGRDLSNALLVVPA